MSSVSARSLRSNGHLDLFVPRVRTALAQCRAFAVAGPSSRNGLPPVLQAKLMSGISTTSCRSLKTFLFPLGASALKAPLTSQYCERRSINDL